MRQAAICSGAVQAAIGPRFIAAETARMPKLLEKQKAGKKWMRQFGKVEIPREAFIEALKMAAEGGGRARVPPAGRPVLQARRFQPRIL